MADFFSKADNDQSDLTNRGVSRRRILTIGAAASVVRRGRGHDTDPRCRVRCFALSDHNRRVRHSGPSECAGLLLLLAGRRSIAAKTNLWRQVMKLQWINHSTFRLEKDGFVAIVDPGIVSPDNVLDDADAVLITHEHADHFQPALIAKRLATKPRLPIWTNRDVARLLDGPVPRCT